MYLKGCKNINYSVSEDPDTSLFEGGAYFVIRNGDDNEFWSEYHFSPTWRQAAEWAERSIKETKDLHHVFLEGATLTVSLPHRPENQATIELSLGS